MRPIFLPENNVVGIGITCKPSRALVGELATFLAQFGPKPVRFAAVDLPATDHMMMLIAALEAVGLELWGIWDEHSWDGENSEEVINAARLMNRLGPDRAVFVYRGGKYHSATSLVSDGEWVANHINLVFFDQDADGFLAYLRGCGITYPHMVEDANRIDGRRGTYRLSQIARVMRDGLLYGCPRPYDNAEACWQARAKIFSVMLKWIRDGYGPEAAQLEQLVAELVAEAKENARRLADRAVIQDGIAFVNAIGLTNPKLIHNATLKGQLERCKSEVFLFAEAFIGNTGPVVHVSLRRDFIGKVDLRELMGHHGDHLPFRLHVRFPEWEDFRRRWVNQGLSAIREIALSKTAV